MYLSLDAAVSISDLRLITREERETETDRERERKREKEREMIESVAVVLNYFCYLSEA